MRKLADVSLNEFNFFHSESLSGHCPNKEIAENNRELIRINILFCTFTNFQYLFCQGAGGWAGGGGVFTNIDGSTIKVPGTTFGTSTSIVILRSTWRS